jgi:glycerate-2-kinase
MTSDQRLSRALDMRVTARHLFEHALSEASIDRAFQRNVECERGVLRICEDLYDLNSYSRVSVISIGKAAHTMVNALEMQAGDRFEGIVASSVEPASQFRGFRYFHGGHPTPNQESIRAADLSPWQGKHPLRWSCFFSAEAVRPSPRNRLMTRSPSQT